MSATPESPESPESRESSAFGGYLLHDVVASDVVTTTYRATPEGTGRPADVALRLVDDRLAGQSRAVKGFLHVNQRVAEIDHPHVLRVVDLGRHGGAPFTATAWRDGLTLADLLLEAAPLDVPDVLRIGGQLAEALDTIHGSGIVHGTVGLPTVWIRRRPGSRVPPAAALTAFGTSHLLVPILPDLDDEPATVELLFVAPEQLRGEPAGPASDQYALGCLLFTALTGTTPYRGETNNNLFGAHLFGKIPHATAAREDLDPAWDDVFARALAKEPDERYDNCRTLLLAAGRCASRRPARPSRPAPPGVTTSPEVDDEPAGSRSRWPLRIVLIALLLLVLLVVVTRSGVLDGAVASAAAGEVVPNVAASGG
ncbi:MAG TPA: serine/threonine-protein kinase [Euzebyales bacterium]|nr:serine/threonine-protein kinase [Euzebyales bacterium]